MLMIIRVFFRRCCNAFRTMMCWFMSFGLDGNLGNALYQSVVVCFAFGYRFVYVCFSTAFVLLFFLFQISFTLLFSQLHFNTFCGYGQTQISLFFFFYSILLENHHMQLCFFYFILFVDWCNFLLLFFLAFVSINTHSRFMFCMQRADYIHTACSHFIFSKFLVNGDPCNRSIINFCTKQIIWIETYIAMRSSNLLFDCCQRVINRFNIVIVIFFFVLSFSTSFKR